MIDTEAKTTYIDVVHLLRIITSNLGLKILALFFAVFLWLVAVLDRSYEVRVRVPIVLGDQRQEARVITDVDARTAVVTISGKGKELLRLRSQRLEFRPVVPEGRFGSRQIKLNVSDLNLPGNLTVRAVEPEMIEVRLGPAASREVRVTVPTKGQPGGGMMVSELRVNTPVRVTGTAADIEQITEIYTETLDLSSVRSNEVRRLAVQMPRAGVTCTPETVEVEIQLEKEGARILLGLPVRVLAPPTCEVRVEPAEAQVAIAGPADRIDSIEPSDITVQIKISSLSPGQYRLGADVVLPEKFRLVKIEPLLFDVTVR